MSFQLAERSYLAETIMIEMLIMDKIIHSSNLLWKSYINT